MSAKRGTVQEDSRPWAAACRAVLSRSACWSMTVWRRKWAGRERRTTVPSPWDACSGVGTKKVDVLGK